MTIDDIREEIGRRIVELSILRDAEEDLHNKCLFEFGIEELEDLERWIAPDVTTTPLDPKPLGGGA